MPDRTIPSECTRVHIVANGTSTEYFARDWLVSIQDEGRTVKLFAQGTREQAVAAKRQRAHSLAEDLEVIQRVAARQQEKL